MTFDAGYRRWRRSRAHALLMGEGYPETVQPFSFVPFAALQDLASLLGLRSGQTLVDLGCGRGGLGLWLAEATGTHLVGVDSSVVAVTDARAQAPDHPGACSRFVVADAARTGLVESVAQGVICVDVLQLVPEPAAVVREAARLLEPGGTLVVTTWEGLGSAPDRFPRALGETLTNAGLDDVDVRVRSDWVRRQNAIYEQATAFAETDDADEALRDLAREARRWRTIAPHVRRVEIAATKPTTP